MNLLRRVAVLGAGTMGSRIAAHFANAGFPVHLLDIVIPGPDRSAAARAGIDSALKQKPGGFYTPAAAELITPGNFEDDLPVLRECDWIVEAVAERLEIKRSLLARVAVVRAPGAVVSTNTSGIPLASITEGFSSEFRRHFLGTHFFNPPRYLHLIEIIPGAETLPEVVRFCSEFSDLRLGKGVVPCKDTPNFIANRIGCFFGATVHQLTVDGGYTVEEVDTLTGPLIGLPRSASYRLVDIIGLDVWAHVMRNLHDLVPGDPWRDRFAVPAFLDRMIERGWLGDKRGLGFYKREGKDKAIHAIDLETLEYRPAQKPHFTSVDAVRNTESLSGRLRALVAAPDRAGTLLWQLFSDLFLYTASVVPEISDRIVEVDRAMRWGYAHSFGPFEYWDALGVPETVRRMESEHREIPENVRRMLASGAASFYRHAGSAGQPRTQYFDLVNPRYREVEPRPGVLVLSDIKRARGVVKQNAGASLVDIGDGVLCLEFHTRLNTLGEDAIAMICAAIDESARNFQALVVANQGENFSAGANLASMLSAAERGDWDELNDAVHRFQQANMAIKYSPRPVVAAPFGVTLGAGCEIVLHAARSHALAETYMGLVETGAGLIPAGGGCKELLLRTGDPKKAFDLIAYAKVSGSAADARALGLLRAEDGVSMNPERLIADARSAALALVSCWSPGAPRKNIRVAGEAGYASLKLRVQHAFESAYITQFDAVIGEKLAFVLSGGRLTGEQAVSEQYLLDLEREAFLSLCGDARTRERMKHLLETGKPLKN